jgi:hypothetical protein
MASASQDMLSVIPEAVKPDLNKIKAFIKKSGRVPVGIKLIEGKIIFSVKLKNSEV